MVEAENVSDGPVSFLAKLLFSIASPLKYLGKYIILFMCVWLNISDLNWARKQCGISTWRWSGPSSWRGVAGGHRWSEVWKRPTGQRSVCTSRAGGGHANNRVMLAPHNHPSGYSKGECTTDDTWSICCGKLMRSCYCETRNVVRTTKLCCQMWKITLKKDVIKFQLQSQV